MLVYVNPKLLIFKTPFNSFIQRSRVSGVARRTFVASCGIFCCSVVRGLSSCRTGLDAPWHVRLSSLTRDQTHIPSVAQWIPLDHQGSPPNS